MVLNWEPRRTLDKDYKVFVHILDQNGRKVFQNDKLPLNTDWAAFVVDCYPDGRCDPRTLYFEQVHPTSTSERYARMSIMPLGGAIMTRR